MPRQLRKRFPGAKYHVMNRGNGSQLIFHAPSDYERFEEQLQYALAADEVILYAYCLMPNHFHLFVETPLGNVDGFMQRLGTAYGLYFRHRHHHPGHCFQGRYKAPLVQGDDYVARLTRYIHLNPVKTKATQDLSGVEKWRLLSNHRWSSISGYLDCRLVKEWVNYRWLERFGDASGRRRQYGTYLRQMLGADDAVLGEAMASSAYAIGDEEFRKEVAEWVRHERMGAPVQSDIDLPAEATIGLAEIATAVASEFGFAPSDLRLPGARLGPARGVFVELACRLSRCSQRDVAAYLANVSEHAVGKARQKLRSALRSDAALRGRVKKLERSLIAKF